MTTTRRNAERVQAHRNRFPWSAGANFYPSNAGNQIEMWRAETFSPDLIDRELGFAQGIGMNLMRVYLHDLVHLHDPDGFLARMDQYLAVAHARGIATLFVFFDDCWASDFRYGPQPEPKPFTHNSVWLQSPGNRITEDPSQWGRLERYVRGVLARFKDDPRIYGWDLYNEPNNNETRRDESLPLLREVFGWARAVDPSQPLTVGLWNFGPEHEELNAFQAAHSDILSYHSYDPNPAFTERVKAMEALADGRRILCSEYMARTQNNTVPEMLPILRAHGIDAINWGLVDGKTQTKYPWGWSAEKGEPPVWFHDLFNPDGTLRYPAEGEVFRRLRNT